MQEMLARLADPVECEDEVKLDEYFGDVALLDEEQTLRKARSRCSAASPPKTSTSRSAASASTPSTRCSTP